MSTSLGFSAPTIHSARSFATPAVGFKKGRILVIMLAFSFLLEPKLFVKYPILNYVYIVGAVFVFCYVCFRALRVDIRLEAPLVFVILYRIALFFPTLMSGGAILDWGYYSLTTFSMVALFSMVRDEGQLRELIAAATYTLFLYLVVNLITMILWPDGIVENLFFLGMRTRVTEVVFVAIAATVYLDYVEGRRLSVRTVAVALVAIAQFVLKDVVTAYVGVAVLAIGLVFCKFLNVRNSGKAFKVIFIACIGLSIALCFYHAQYLFKDFIENVLNRSVSLSYREGIWNVGISLFGSSPLFGYGIVDDGNHIQIAQSWAVESWQAHNNLLQILLDGGLVALVCFSAFVWSVGSALAKNVGSYPRRSVLLAVWLAYNVMSVTEIFVLQNYYFLFLAMSYAIARVGLTPQGACREKGVGTDAILHYRPLS
ncbi:O-antigen ligase family protein [Enteroscipio rubneri]|uniref:O-antigen ligase family protein n=1 Tax=Enteroscipio rubneri TaxID=2070686 RepID=UPI003AF1193F